MSEDEDDYLSDKFLSGATTSGTAAHKTYSERRKEAQRLAAIKNEQNRKKTRRQLELESREEGLSKSLFERVKEEESAGQSKALAMMMKMGFKPGQSLGNRNDDAPSEPPATRQEQSQPPEQEDPVLAPKPGLGHRVVPLPLNEWTGKQGIGSVKRAASPSASERLAKMAKMKDSYDHNAFRDRARQEYEDRRAEGRLSPAQRTCLTLDEKDGREFNVLWLNPNNPETFPEGFLDELDDPELVLSLQKRQPDGSIEGRLKARMQADALQPLTSLEDDTPTASKKAEPRPISYSEEDVKEAVQFLRLNANDRLELVLDYLRRRYSYCFWCGTQYEDAEDMENNCPGVDEDDH
ncbi:hypothetical protein PHLCEN_2v10547 [Hermanssonia centrifuga]|uniref:G-patch domain-containing protein n=1 Tax=Hermanssonia centrifuga TaxID=98765 RepID=A0A2R6NML3_9APHY|nr:hypothetical protein PHLCEN_2v10547 [Hermanssonia centrifuga]